jgi:tetratricopeptide (TPR) repeat protein
LASVATPARVRADTVTLNSGKIRKLVRIRDIRKGRLVFAGSTGRKMSASLGEVRRIEVAGATVLNIAETEFAAGEFSQAAATYEGLQIGGSNGWQSVWIQYRLLKTFDHLGRFAEAVGQFCVLVEISPELAVELTPKNWPGPSSTFYPDALALLEQARVDTSNPAARTAIHRLELRIHQYVGTSPPKGTDPSGAPTLRGSADPDRDPIESNLVRRLSLIQKAIERKAFARAVELADAMIARPEVGDNGIAALLVLRGTALFEQASSREDYLNASLSLMRVVIHFPDSDAAAEAGYYAALVMERVRDPAMAAVLLDEALPRAGDREELIRKIRLAQQRVQ